MDKIHDLYNSLLSKDGFRLDKNNTKFGEDTSCYTLNKNAGKGNYWVYFYKDMFTITIRDFVFYEDFFINLQEPDFLAIEYYSSVSGEQFHPYYQLSPNTLRVYIGGNNKNFQAIYHKDIPIQSVGITIMPDYYKRYLKEKFSEEYVDPKEAFRKVTLVSDFPELAAILKQIQHYRGSGMTAKLFYESKVLETIALIAEKANDNKKKKGNIHITEEDKENLEDVIAYIDNHYVFSISLSQLSHIACMSETKLKSVFKECYGCTISEYIVQMKMCHAQHLLIHTDLSITEISKAIGYKRSDSFSKQFQKITGILPREYRKYIEHDT